VITIATEVEREPLRLAGSPGFTVGRGDADRCPPGPSPCTFLSAPRSPAVTPAALPGRATLESVHGPRCAPVRSVAMFGGVTPSGLAMAAANSKLAPCSRRFRVASPSSVKAPRCRSSCVRRVPRFSRHRVLRQRRLSTPPHSPSRHTASCLFRCAPRLIVPDKGGDHEPSWFDVTPDWSARRPPPRRRRAGAPWRRPTAQTEPARGERA
jgi:hypothetical protein